MPSAMLSSLLAQGKQKEGQEKELRGEILQKMLEWKERVLSQPKF